MDDCLKEALEIVKAQASVRNMTEEEISSMVRRLSESIRSLQGAGVAEDAAEVSAGGLVSKLLRQTKTCSSPYLAAISALLRPCSAP